uniref:Uncharacterized protein n=1 Tax=Caenorhabditis japonica TaxID=281687 RepID=A0A8R1E0Z2_CAEJA
MVLLRHLDVDRIPQLARLHEPAAPRGQANSAAPFRAKLVSARVRISIVQPEQRPVNQSGRYRAGTDKYCGSPRVQQRLRGSGAKNVGGQVDGPEDHVRRVYTGDSDFVLQSGAVQRLSICPTNSVRAAAQVLQRAAQILQNDAWRTRTGSLPGDIVAEQRDGQVFRGCAVLEHHPAMLLSEHVQ